MFMDLPNKNKLKIKLSEEYNFLNSRVFKKNEYSKANIKTLSNMEWNPKIKLFYTLTNFNYNNNLGKSHACPF